MVAVNSLFPLEERAVARQSFSLRRSHLEIRMDILSCIRAGFDKPTQVMYKANLSWGALKGHLDALEDGGLVRSVEYGNRRRYEVTERALAVLASYEKILSEISTPIHAPEPAF